MRSIALVTPLKTDTDKIFGEVRERLSEECDYRRELANLLEFGRFFAEDRASSSPPGRAALHAPRADHGIRGGESADQLCGTGTPRNAATRPPA